MKEGAPPQIGATNQEIDAFYKDLFFEAFGYPMGWSEWLSEHTSGDLQELHKKRLDVFRKDIMGDNQEQK